MRANWEETVIGVLLERDGGELQTGPFGTKLKAAEYTKHGVPVISVGEIGRGRILLHDDTPRVDDSVTSRMPEYLLDAGDIVFGRKGAVERSAWIRPHQAGWFTGSDAIRLRLPSTCDARFIAYQLQTPAHRSWMIQHAAGSTMASLNEGIIRRIPIVLPPRDEQEDITSVLSSLDDKIDLNTRMNETLEAMAHAVFKDWFVDFGPSHAKAEGLPAYLSNELWALFPNNLDGEGKPEGWDSSEIGKEARCVGGSTPSTADTDLWNGGVVWATPKDLSRLNAPVLLSTERTISQKALDKISSGLLPVGSVLLSSRAPIGYLAIAEVPVAINQGFIALIPEGRLSNIFLWQWVIANMDAIHQKANGSTFQEISKANFRPLPVLVPAAPVLKQFDEIARPLYERIRDNEIETRSLVALRDFLLPKLLSGEILLKDAENKIEEAL